MRILYNALLTLLIPFAIARLLWKSRRQPGYRKHLGERFAVCLPSPPAGTRLWVHAVSVGEFIAIRPLLEHLLKEKPELSLWLTCTTPTGREQQLTWQMHYPERIRISFFPYDLPILIRRFLRHVQPSLAIFMETELWPNTLREAQKRDIPTYLVNARLSAKSLRGYYRFARPLLTSPLSRLHVSAQSVQDGRRLQTLGVQADHLHILPSLKFATPPKKPEPLTETFPFTKKQWLWIAASTHDPEEAYALQAHQRIQRKNPLARLCIAPRHPERREQIIHVIREYGFRPRLRSQGESLEEARDVLLLDTLGELGRAYQSSEVAFIGGSLLDHGGHNPLEALQAGNAVCFGPSMRNFQQISERLRQFPYVQQTTVETLAKTVLRLHNYLVEHGSQDILNDSAQQAGDVLARHSAQLLRCLRNAP